jgi:hypothetical protein
LNLAKKRSATAGLVALGIKEYAGIDSGLRIQLAVGGRTAENTYQATNAGIELGIGREDTWMLDDLLREYYETGEAEGLRKIIHQMHSLVIRLLAQCVADPAIRVRI